MTLLHAEAISVRRAGRTLVDSVSFTARARRVLGIIGPNGAGKTTLFDALAGYAARDSGHVTVEGDGYFYLPDGLRAWPERRAQWCLDFVARLYGGAIDDEAIAALSLQPLLHQRVASLSKGEHKRLMLAAALSVPRTLLLLDEPFDGLDFRQTERAIALLRARAGGGKALVLSIHQLHDAVRVCDDFLLLDNGRALASGTLQELRAHVKMGDASLEEIFLALE